MSEKRKRVKNPSPAPVVEPVRERVKAGSPGSPLALAEAPAAPAAKKATAKKTAAKK